MCTLHNRIKKAPYCISIAIIEWFTCAPKLGGGLPVFLIDPLLAVAAQRWNSDTSTVVLPRWSRPSSPVYCSRTSASAPACMRADQRRAARSDPTAGRADCWMRGRSPWIASSSHEAEAACWDRYEILRWRDAGSSARWIEGTCPACAVTRPYV